MHGPLAFLSENTFFFFLTEKISSVDNEMLCFCPFPKLCQILLYHKASMRGASRLLSGGRGWMGGQGGDPVLCRDPRSCSVCSRGQKGKVTSAASHAAGHMKMRSVFCFVRANSLKKPPNAALERVEHYVKKPLKSLVMSVPSRICHPVAKLVEKESGPGFNCCYVVREKDQDIRTCPGGARGRGRRAT